MGLWNKCLKIAGCLPLVCATGFTAAPESIQLASGWMLQDANKVTEDGAILSVAGYQPARWHRATVPGTVLTSLVDDGTYPGTALW
jgi:hypothetical protein